MAGNVLLFPTAGERQAKEPVQLCWVCNCGSHTFRLIYGGAIECEACGMTQDVIHFDPKEKP